jgi:hypothetical protein
MVLFSLTLIPIGQFVFLYSSLVLFLYECALPFFCREQKIEIFFSSHTTINLMCMCVYDENDREKDNYYKKKKRKKNEKMYVTFHNDEAEHIDID